MFFPASEWFAAFVLTVIVEIVVVAFLVRGIEPRLGRLALLVVFANLATHPIVWYVLTQPFLVGTPEYLVVAESWAVVAEAVFYAVTIGGLGPRRAAIVAFVANLASFGAGQLLTAVGAWVPM